MAPEVDKKAATATGQRTLHGTWSTTRTSQPAPPQRTASKKRPAEGELIVLSSDNEEPTRGTFNKKRKAKDELIVLSSDDEEPTRGTFNKKRKAKDEPDTLQAPWSSWQPPPTDPKRTFPQKRKAGDKPITPIPNPGESSGPAPQRKKGRAKQPVVPLSDSVESGSDFEDALGDIDDPDDEDYNDDRSAEEIEEAERAQLLRALESQDTLTADQAMVLEPQETFAQESTHNFELDLENLQKPTKADKSNGFSNAERAEFILLHLTSLVDERLFDQLSAFVEATLPPRTQGELTPGPRLLCSVPVPKQRRSEWVFEDPRLEKIWSRMVDRLTGEAVRSKYTSFDPAMLVAPSGSLDDPILFGLHWPPWTEKLGEYSSMRDMMQNACIKWLDENLGLQNALTFDFRPLAFKKPENYSEHPPWYDMPPRMLEIINETLREIMDASSAKAAVYFGKHDYEIYQTLYPNSVPLKLSSVPMYRQSTHACIEYSDTGEIRRIVFFCYHPEAAIRGVHPVQAQLMEKLCQLATMIAGRTRVCHDMFSHSNRAFNLTRRSFRPNNTPFGKETRATLRKETRATPRKETRATPRELAYREGYKHAFNLACRVYAKEAKTGVLCTLQSLPRRLHKFLDPTLKVNEWRRVLVLDGLETLDIDDATDERIRQALRETIADAKPNSSSLALQVVCKLLEEPIMHFKGSLEVKENRHYYDKRKVANRAGFANLMKATLNTYLGFIPSPTFEPHSKNNWTNVKRKPMEKLEHAGARDLTLQLVGKHPRYIYDPDSRLGALWLLSKLPWVHPEDGWMQFRTFKKDDDGTLFSEEKRNLNTLWKQTTWISTSGKFGSHHHDKFFNYVIPKIRAHEGLQDRIPQTFKKYLK